MSSEPKNDINIAKELSDESNLELWGYVGKLKKVKRTGWVRRGVPEVESVAEHTYRMAFLWMLYWPQVNSWILNKSGEKIAEVVLDVNKCIQMWLVHDLAEGIVGDLVIEGEQENRDKITKEEKWKLEEDAIVKILGGKRPDLLKLWEEYENQSSNEWVFVKDLDKLEMLIQAHEYEIETGIDLSDFYASTNGKFVSKVANSVDTLLRKKKEERDQAK